MVNAFGKLFMHKNRKEWSKSNSYLIHCQIYTVLNLRSRYMSKSWRVCGLWRSICKLSFLVLRHVFSRHFSLLSFFFGKEESVSGLTRQSLHRRLWAPRLWCLIHEQRVDSFKRFHWIDSQRVWKLLKHVILL